MCVCVCTCVHVCSNKTGGAYYVKKLLRNMGYICEQKLNKIIRLEMDPLN